MVLGTYWRWILGTSPRPLQAKGTIDDSQRPGAHGVVVWRPHGVILWTPSGCAGVLRNTGSRGSSDASVEVRWIMSTSTLQ